MSEQLKQELEDDTDRLEAETVADSETIGEQEEKPTEGKLEAQEDDESKEEDTVPMGKASLADIVSGIPAPTKEEVEAAEAENAKPVKQKAREKLEAEKKKATQKNFADPVITYLMKRCEEDQGLAEDVMQEGKTWNNAVTFYCFIIRIRKTDVLNRFVNLHKKTLLSLHRKIPAIQEVWLVHIQFLFRFLFYHAFTEKSAPFLKLRLS